MNTYGISIMVHVNQFQKREDLQMPIYDVFISYRRSDGAELAAVVANALRAKGLSVFFDTEEIKSGEDFTLRIENALRQAPNYLLIATPDVFKFRTDEKDWVLEEMKIACENYAHNLDKNRMFTLVVPQHVYRDVDRNDPAAGKRREVVELPKAETWPAEVFDLSKPNRIQLRSNLPDEKELKKIHESVTRVTHHNMWNAGHRWLMENRQPGRRFASLDISKTIFPHAYTTDAQEEEEENDFPSMVQQQQSPSAKPEGEKLPLFDALAKTENHIYLVGEGGIGKTTSLIHIMERAYQNREYSEEAQVPLFVELSKAPDTAGRLYANGKSTFICRAIYRQIRQDRTVKQVTGAEVEETEDAFIADPQTAVTPVKALLGKQNKPPQYLLLLDGLNEVSRTELVIKPTENGKETGEPDIHKTVYDMIVKEINDIMKTCPNVQIVLTGRADDGTVQKKNITRWQLTGIDDESIRTYLDGKVPENEIKEMMGNRALLDTLRIPLFLTMYIRLKEKTGITTQGEILHTFFTEKGKQLGDYDLPYSMRNRLGQVEKELDRSAKGKPDLRLTATMQFFMVDFLLAALGRYMEKNNLFSVTVYQAEEVICPILEGTAPTSVCGQFGQQAFTKYNVKNTMSGTAYVAQQLKALIGTGNLAAQQFCLLASAVLGILVDDGNHNYSFIHQHVRDYFAALHVMNALWIGVVCSWTNREAAYAFLNSELAQKPLGFTVRQMLGEAAGEHHNKPWRDEEDNWHYNVPDKTKPHNRNLIPLAMDVYRGHFDEQNSYALWNLIQVLKEVRQDLCGEDFSRLDLTQIRLNRHHPGKRGCAANFAGAKLQRELFMPEGHAGAVFSAAYSPNGKRIVTASEDGTAKIWDAETLLELGTLEGHTSHVNSATYSPDGKRIVTASVDKTAKIWDTETFLELGMLEGHTDRVISASYSPDGKRIVTASHDKTAKIWDAETFKVLGTLKPERSFGLQELATLPEEELSLVVSNIRFFGVHSASYSPDGKRIVTVSNRKTLKAWDAVTFREIGTLEGHTDRVLTASYSQDGKRIVTASGDRTATIWNAETFHELGILENVGTEVQSASYSPDGKRIVTASWAGGTKVWDAETLREQKKIGFGWDTGEFATYSPDGKMIITTTSSFGHPVKLWSAEDFREVGALGGEDESKVYAKYSMDGKRIIMTSSDFVARIWDAETFRELETDFESLMGFVSGWSLWVYSPDEKQIAQISDNRIVDVFDTKTSRKLGTLEGHTGSLSAVAYSPDGKRIITASEDKTAKVWDGETFREMGTLIGHTDGLISVTFNPNGKQIVTTSRDHTVKVWDTETFAEMGTLKETDWIDSVVYSPDGQRIAIASGKSINMYEAETLQELGSITVDVDRGRHIVYSPDSKRIAAFSQYKDEIVIWDAETFQELGTLKGHKASVNSAVYSSDNRHILTASRDGTVKIWDAETFKCIRTIRNVANLEVMGCDFRNLHPDSRLSDEDRQLLWDYGADV